MKIISALLTYHFVIFLAAVAIGMSFVMRGKSEQLGGGAVGSRFLESPDELKALVHGKLSSDAPVNLSREAKPSAKDVAEKLQAWVADPRNKDARLAYASPILMRYDMIFLIALGLFLAIAPALIAWPALSSSLAWPVSGLLVAVIALPGAVYLITDIIEDLALAGYLSGTKPITPKSIGTTMSLTSIKINSVVAGMGVTAVAALIGVVADLVAAFKA